MSASSPQSSLLDSRTFAEGECEYWPAFLVRRAEIELAIEALMKGQPDAQGRRESLIVHPKATKPGMGLAPGIATAFGVLLAGESTRPRRTNASSFSMALSGTGCARIGGLTHELSRWDCWNTPGMHNETIENTGSEPFVYITYCNSPYLRKLEAYYEELDPPVGQEAAHAVTEKSAISEKITRAKEIAGGPVSVSDTGAQILPYEHLIDPEFVESKSLHWPWSEVGAHMGLLRRLGQGYNGRPLVCLYNPATGNRNGTTFSFFATITSAAPNFTGPAHRHMSSAINYILEGSGWSVVNGERLDWATGDIMLSAPGWAAHGHATNNDGAVILTIQDHPLHIATESLIWQEDLKNGPILTLGSESGFQTNLPDFKEGT